MVIAYLIQFQYYSVCYNTLDTQFLLSQLLSGNKAFYPAGMNVGLSNVQTMALFRVN